MMNSNTQRSFRRQPQHYDPRHQHPPRQQAYPPWQQHQQQDFPQPQRRHVPEQRPPNANEDTIPVASFGEGSLTVCPVADCRQQFPANFTQADFGFVFQKDLQEVVGSTKGERRRLIQQFLRMVNALLNQGGGLVYIHTSPHLLNFWDEQVDDDLMDLIPDDSLFDENFERHVEEGHVIFRVKPRDRPLSTLDFQSKVSLNKGLDDPTHGQMRRLLTRAWPDHVPPPWVPFQPGALVQGQQVCFFHENAAVQAKVVLEPDLLAKTPRHLTDRPSRLLHFWWTHLKLPNYIAAFAKQEAGGSFFLGLREDKRVTGSKWKAMDATRGLRDVFLTDMQVWADDKNTEDKKIFHVAREDDVPKLEHKSGHFLVEGVSLNQTERQTLHDLLQARVRDDLPCRPSPQPGHRPPHAPLVDLVFHPVTQADQGEGGAGGRLDGGGRGTGRSATGPGSSLTVVEARVQYFHGVCFHNRRGPEAFKFDHDNCPSTAVRVPLDTWVQAQA